MIKLSVLDYAQIDEHETPTQALNNTVSLAQYAEYLGYHRFWVAEHHNVPAFLSSSPEVLMMHLLNNTSTISIGSGGVMLPHYAPLKVAENFKILSRLFPGRVDLGIGNTKGTRIVNQALNETKKRFLDYKEAIQDLQGFIADDLPEEHRHHEVKANPAIDQLPSMWVLSTSVDSAIMAAELGIGYCYGFFPYANRDALNTAQEASQVYRSNFKPSGFMEQAQISIAVFACIGDTPEEAEAFGRALDLWLLGTNNFSEHLTYPSIDTANQYSYSDKEKQRIENNRSRMVVGTAEQVRDQLLDRAQLTQADEILVIPLMPGIENRKAGLKSLAQAFDNI